MVNVIKWKKYTRVWIFGSTPVCASDRIFLLPGWTPICTTQMLRNLWLFKPKKERKSKEKGYINKDLYVKKLLQYSCLCLWSNFFLLPGCNRVGTTQMLPNLWLFKVHARKHHLPQQQHQLLLQVEIIKSKVSLKYASLTSYN